ncbi:MAG: carboxypeptidase-like regulatory domain-containing protein, partial [Bacteroidetes bacterium]|nr:carboxypeptidase-like regulatory domain-containing protein [Bacteroidota bacterium]
MRLTIFLALSFLIANLSFSQTGRFSGRIIHEGEPIEFAKIGLKGTNLGAVSDQSGSFEIKEIPFGTYEIVVSIIGFQTQKTEIILGPDQTSHQLDFYLQESNYSMNEVVISGTMKEVNKLDSPVPVEVYSAEFFEANPTPSIFESMQNVNGVRPQLNCNVCNTGDIHINGLEGPYTMILIDGMPIVSGLSTVYGLTGIPQSLVERVEIVKGPASTLYGSEAVGGLINIITKKPVNAPLVSADVFATSWQEVNTDLGVKFKAGSKAHSLLGINYFNYQNPLDKNGDHFTDVTLQNRLSVFNKWSFNRKDHKAFSIAARYVYEDRWGGEMNWEPKYRGGDLVYGESIYTSRWETFGVYQLPVKEVINFQFSANGHNQNSVYGDTKYLADQYIGFAQLTWNKTLGERHDLLVGSAYRYTYYDDNTTATDDIATGENSPSITHLPGLFAQDEIVLN